MAGYLLTAAAQHNLEDIRKYLAGAPQVVRHRVIDKLIATFEQAARFPETGRAEPELQRHGGITRSLLRYPYPIFYYPETSPLEIFAIVHGKRGPLAVLSAR